MKSKIINSIIIIASVVLLLGYMLFVDGLDNILSVFANAKLGWLLAGAGCMLLYWLLETTIVHTSLNCFHCKMNFHHTFKTTMIGQFFNCVTPSATGGQPMQAYYMSRIGIGVGYGTSALLIRFIVYQLGLTLYSVVVLIFHYRTFASQISGFKYLILLGFALNTIVAVGLLLVGFTKNTARVLMRGIMRILAKIHLVKHLDEKLETVDREVEKFREGFQIIRQNVPKLIQMFLMTLFQLTAYFLVPLTIAMAFGVPMDLMTAVTIIGAASCVQMASSFIPLPGSAGGAELSFFLLFQMFFPKAQLSSAILLWRMFTFYLPILLGTFFARDIFGKKISLSELAAQEEQA